MKIIKLIILFVMAWCLELVFSGGGFTGLISPRPVLVFVLLTAFFSGAVSGGIAGFASGFIYAVLFGETLGISMLVLFLIGWQSGRLAPFLEETPWIVPLVTGFIIIIEADLFYSILTSLFHGPELVIRPLTALTGGILLSVLFRPAGKLLERG